MIENNRRKTVPIDSLEIAELGYANGLSLQIKELLEKNEKRSLTEEEKKKIIDEAAVHYGAFLDALGVNWKEDPNSAEN